MKIDWKKLTIEDAQDLADQLSSAFSLVVKCVGMEKFYDVSYLDVVCRYDDNLHGDKDVEET